MRRFPQSYPIRGLYQVGAWTFPGAGFIATLLSARVLVDRYFSPGFRWRRSRPVGKNLHEQKIGAELKT